MSKTAHTDQEYSYPTCVWSLLYNEINCGILIGVSVAVFL